MSPRQRRGALLVVLAGLAAVLCVAAVVQYTADVSAQLGPRRPVVVLAREVPAYTAIDSTDVELRQVPVIFAPDGALSSPAQLTGRVSPVALPPGTLLQEAALVPPPVLAPGERAVTVLAGGEQSLGYTLAAGDVVDVIAGYPRRSRDEDPVRVELEQVSVLVVTPVRSGVAEGVFVTLAVSTTEALALGRALTADATLVVARRPPEEVEP
jgi:Flp pilus assembly protein CpaB